MKYFDLKVGFSCNNDCIHCVITDKKSTKDLTTEEIKKVIDTIPTDTMVGFTGGEATIRKDFIELLKYAKDTGHLSALQSNVAKFADWEFAEEAGKYLDNVLVAIHSHEEEIHDSIVSTPGMYKKTIQGFKNLIKLGVDCSTQTVISKLNVNNILKTYDLIQEISPGIRMNLTFPHPNGNAWTNRDQVVPRYTEIKDVIQSVLKKYHMYISTEAIPLCYLYPYQDKVFNYDTLIMTGDARPGLDPANKETDFFDETGRTDNYQYSQFSDRRKGPKCKECSFNDECLGVWKEYVEIYKDNFDLYPIILEEKSIPSITKDYKLMNPEELILYHQDNNEIKECRDEPLMNKEWGSIIIYSDTGVCMNRCAFCEGSSMVIDEETKFNIIISNADHFIEKEIKQVEISGGDPGEYNRIVEVVQYLTDNSIEVIQLSTHGRTLKDENLVRRLKDAGLTEARIPLYGSTAEIHNNTTQYKSTPGNSFEDTIQGIKNCAKHGIKIVGHILTNQYNKNDLNNILQLYIDLSKDQLKSLFIGITFIAHLNYDYTNNWYLPIKDLGPYIRKVYNNPSIIPEGLPFALLDIPYCVLGEYTKIIDNKFEGFPNLGNHKVEEENRSDISDNIPHYRIKSYFDECVKCKYHNICGAIPLNEIKMFGTYGLKGFKE